MIYDVRDIIEKGICSFNDALSEIRKLASTDNWKKREDEIIKEIIIWAYNEEPNIRSTTIESLRGLAIRDPDNCQRDNKKKLKFLIGEYKWLMKRKKN